MFTCLAVAIISKCTIYKTYHSNLIEYTYIYIYENTIRAWKIINAHIVYLWEYFQGGLTERRPHPGQERTHLLAKCDERWGGESTNEEHSFSFFLSLPPDHHDMSCPYDDKLKSWAKRTFSPFSHFPHGFVTATGSLSSTSPWSFRTNGSHTTSGQVASLWSSTNHRGMEGGRRGETDDR